MHIAKMRKLVDVLAVDLQFLSSHRVAWSAFCAARFGCLYATRAKRVEESVLAFGGVRGEVGTGAGVLFFEVVPLVVLVWLRNGRGSVVYLYARVLRAEIYSVVVAGVCDTENVSNIVRRPQRVKTTESRRAPDLYGCN